MPLYMPFVHASMAAFLPDPHSDTTRPLFFFLSLSLALSHSPPSHHHHCLPSHALFNKIVRDSVVKVRWEVEWFEEGDGEDDQDVNGEGEDMAKGTWILTMARYFIKIANQLLVEEVGFADNQSKGFVMLTADVNVKLRYCHKMKGAEDFDRLIKDGTVQSTPDATEVPPVSVVSLVSVVRMSLLHGVPTPMQAAHCCI